MKKHQYCCVDGCYNSRKDKNFTFFFLPSDRELREEWLKIIGRLDLLQKLELRPRSYQVCHVHFDNTAMYETVIRKLLPRAVPSRHLTGQSSAYIPPNSSKPTSSDANTQTKKSDTQLRSQKTEIKKEYESESENGEESDESETDLNDETDQGIIKVEFEVEPDNEEITRKSRKRKLSSSQT